MDLSKRMLGILLSTKPEHPNLVTAVDLCREALNRGVDVYLYLVDDGVYALDQPEIQDLSLRGAKLFACAYGAQRRGIPLSEKATFCGLVVLSDLVEGCERFVALN